MTGTRGYLRDECKRLEINFFNPDEQFFAPCRATLDAVMKERTAEGMVVVKHTENLTVDEVPELLEKGVRNKFTPKSLRYEVFYYNLSSTNVEFVVCGDCRNMNSYKLNNLLLTLQMQVNSKSYLVNLDQRL